MNKIYTLVTCIMGLGLLSAQEGRVGINTDSPKSTLDVRGKTDASGNTLSTDITGLQAPRLTLAELTAKGNTLYGVDQKGVLIFISDISGGDTSGSRANITTVGYYFFDGSQWKLMSPSITSNNYGDIKTGIQTTDHNGWVKLDGRLKSVLLPTQQAQATALGIGSHLPDATGSVLMQNGSALGTVSGSNSKTLTLANLPNINLTASNVSAGIPSGSVSVTAATAGTPAGSVSIANTTSTMQNAGDHNHFNPSTTRGTSTNGDHNHNYGRTDPAGEIVAAGSGAVVVGRENVTISNTTANSGLHNHTIDVGNYNTNSSGTHNHIMNAHTHTATFTGTILPTHAHAADFIGTALNSHNHSVPLGGSDAPVDITPKSLSVNTFIYLGN